MSKKIPTEILEQKLDKFIAANLEQAVLDQAGAEEAQTELSDRYDVKVGEVRQRLIDLGVSESIVDEVIIGHLVKEAKPVSEMAAYAAEITQNFRAAAENLENRFQATHRAFQLTGISLVATGVRYGWLYVTLGTILDIGVALHQSSLHYKKNEVFPYSRIKYSKIFPYKLLMPE